MDCFHLIVRVQINNGPDRNIFSPHSSETRFLAVWKVFWKRQWNQLTLQGPGSLWGYLVCAQEKRVWENAVSMIMSFRWYQVIYTTVDKNSLGSTRLGTYFVEYQLDFLSLCLNSKISSRRSTNFASSSSSSAEPSMSSAKQRSWLFCLQCWQCLRDLLRCLSWSFPEICWRGWVRVGIPVGLQLLSGTSLLYCCYRGQH